MKQNSTHSFRIALLVETSSKIGRDLLQGIQRFSHEHNNWNLDLQPGGLNQVLPDPRTWRGTGFVARAFSPSLFKKILKTRLPTVFFTLSDQQRKVVAGRAIMEVLVDAQSVGELAARHLRERGLQHFAFVGPPDNPDWSRRRQHAFSNCLSRNNLKLHVYEGPVQPQRSWTAECRFMIRWLKRLPKPLGVMATNDARGLQVLDACRQAGLAVPHEVAVIGVDNDELICSLCHPPLTSITLGAVDAGYRTAGALHALMQYERVQVRQIFIPATQVIARESTATAVASDWRAEKARRFILQKAGEMIQVRDVVDYVGVSRRSLEAHFARTVGHSLLQEILRVRIEKVKSMLLSSGGGPIHLMAQRAGFSNANYLCKAFKKAVGCSPQAYRAHLSG